MIMPAVSLGIVSSALLLRIMRASMIEVLSSDYIRTALAKGATRGIVIWPACHSQCHHPLSHGRRRRVRIPLRRRGDHRGHFLLPGIGSLVLVGIINRDYPVLLGGGAGHHGRRADRKHGGGHYRESARSAAGTRQGGRMTVEVAHSGSWARRRRTTGDDGVFS